MDIEMLRKAGGEEIMAKLKGKVAVVTGASKGIGASIAEQLAAEGASVVVNYSSSKEGADAVVRRITEKGGKAIAAQADVSKPGDITRLIDQTRKAFGKLDILVNNAGIYEFAPLGTVTPEHFHKQFDLNVLGLILTTQEAVKLIGEGGSVINISSLVGPMPLASASVYSATKAAVDAVTIALSKELGPRKIRVNSLNPGLVLTEGVHAAGFDDGEFRKGIEAQTPLGRVGQPEDIASAAVFFASDDSAWITGQSLLVAGGLRQ
jgi:3-oxoacyl-[acyl-carrier protein] reductase